MKKDRLPDFEQIVLPHLDAAYNLARWLVHSSADAEDVAQEACFRTMRFFEGFRGGDSRAWVLKIVRNTAYSWLKKNPPAELTDEFDETLHSDERLREAVEAKLVAGAESNRVRAALETLPTVFREVLVLREIEGLSYKEISDATGSPMGTVMSSLSRTRQHLRHKLQAVPQKEVSHHDA
jgi:RNA polymerase sigma-70 factor, ECF subfamily